jgi:hypothetical protein
MEAKKSKVSDAFSQRYMPRRETICETFEFSEPSLPDCSPIVACVCNTEFGLPGKIF